MEQFTRECLEIDSEATNDAQRRPPDSYSMDKVYQRAAKLVKKTLDVEGAIVMDVSHGDVLETMSSEGTISIIVHSADGSQERKSHVLTSEDYRKMYEMFTKYPDGKISEGLVPGPLRPFIPSGIQYALSEYLPSHKCRLRL